LVRPGDWQEIHPFVMAGLDPAIHVLLRQTKKDVDARLKAGHDELNHKA
jgi:hypothetical protein